MRIKEILEKIIEELKLLPFTEAIVLFGSHAKNKATSISDVDVCVIDNEKFPKEKRREVYQYSTDKINISLFSDLPLYIKYEVFKGKLLFVKDKSNFRRLRENITLEYLNKKWLWEDYFRRRKWSIQTK